MTGDDDIYGLQPDPEKKDEDYPALRPEEPRSEGPRVPQPSPEEPADVEELNRYELGRLPDDGEEIGKKVHERQRRKRNRSLLLAEKPTSPFTIQQGWLDGCFSIPTVVFMLILAVFFSPLVFPVALFGAITAFDPEARRWAYYTMGFCLLPFLLIGCIYCMIPK